MVWGSLKPSGESNASGASSGEARALNSHPVKKSMTFSEPGGEGHGKRSLSPDVHDKQLWVRKGLMVVV